MVPQEVELSAGKPPLGLGDPQVLRDVLRGQGSKLLWVKRQKPPSPSL